MKIALLIFIVCSYRVFSQPKISMSIPKKLTNEKFVYYKDSIKISGNYMYKDSSLNDFLNQIYSTTTLEQYKKFCNGFDAIVPQNEFKKKSDTLNNFWLLVHVFYFINDADEYVLIKYFDIQSKNKKLNSFQCKKINGIWKLVQEKKFSDIEQLIRISKSHFLVDLFNKKDSFRDIYDRVNISGVINLNKVSLEIQKIKYTNFNKYKEIADE